MTHTAFRESRTRTRKGCSRLSSELLTVLLVGWRTQLSSARLFRKQEGLGFPSLRNLWCVPIRKGMCRGFLTFGTEKVDVLLMWQHCLSAGKNLDGSSGSATCNHESTAELFLSTQLRNSIKVSTDGKGVLH